MPTAPRTSPRRLALLAAAVALAAALVVGWLQHDASPHHTLFGTSLPPTVTGSTSARSALQMMAQRTGPPEVVRLYSSDLPEPLAGSVSDVGRIPAVVSFKADPASVVAGDYDDSLAGWFASAPADRLTFWAYFHEPEDDVERGSFTAAQFRAAWQHIDGLADEAGNPDLRSTVILMCWTLNPQSGRTWTDYVDSDTADVVAWDCYNHGWKTGAYLPPAEILGRSVQASAEAGSSWGIAELGSQLAVGDDGVGRAAWLESVGAYARDEQAVFVTYFDSPVGGTFELDDEPTQEAFRDLLR